MNGCIRLAEKRDIPELCKLWITCFDDSEDYIQYFYKENFEHIDIYVYSVNGKPVSMVHTMDCCFVYGEEQNKVKFIYAVGTLAEYRKKGYFTELMKYVVKTEKQKGFALFLKPASPLLIPVYEKLGFKQDAVFRLVTVQPEKKKPMTVSALSYKEYNRMRNAAFSEFPYAKWSDRHVKWCVEENEYYSGKTIAINLDGKQHFLMASPEDDTLLITETDLSSGQLKDISGALCDLFGTALIKAYMPDFLCDEGEEIVSSLVNNLPLRNTYVNLILI